MFEFVTQGLICTKKKSFVSLSLFHCVIISQNVTVLTSFNIYIQQLSFCTNKRPENVSTSEIKCCNFVSHGKINCPDTVWSRSTSAWPSFFSRNTDSADLHVPWKAATSTSCFNSDQTGNKVFSVVTVYDDLNSSFLSNKLQHHSKLPGMNVNSESFVYTSVCNLSCLLLCNYHTESSSDWYVSLTVVLKM